MNRLPRKELAVAAVIGAVLLAVWFMVLRPDSERISTYGFDMRTAPSGSTAGGGTGGGSPWQPRSSLNSGLRGGFSRDPATSPSVVTGPAASASSAGSSAPAAGSAGKAAAPPAPGENKDDDPAAQAKDGKAFGVPIDDKGLARAGATPGMLDRVAGAIMAHPTLIKLLFNNKMFVNAYYNRDSVKRKCNDSRVLASYLSNTSDPKGVSEEFGMIKTVLSKPDSARAFAETEFASRIPDCPAVQALSNDPKAMMGIALANPSLVTLLSDQTGLALVTANAKAADVLQKVQASQGF